MLHFLKASLFLSLFLSSCCLAFNLCEQRDCSNCHQDPKCVWCPQFAVCLYQKNENASGTADVYRQASDICGQTVVASANASCSADEKLCKRGDCEEGSCSSGCVPCSINTYLGGCWPSPFASICSKFGMAECPQQEAKRNGVVCTLENLLAGLCANQSTTPTSSSTVDMTTLASTFSPTVPTLPSTVDPMALPPSLTTSNNRLPTTSIPPTSLQSTSTAPPTTVPASSDSTNVASSSDSTSATRPTSSTTFNNAAVTQNAPGLNAAEIGGITAGSTVSVCCFIMVIMIFVWRRRRGPRKYSLNQLEMNQQTLERPLDLIANITIKKHLGAGNFGEVYLGDYEGTPCACKKLVDKASILDFNREASTLSKLHHPNIVQLLGVYVSPKEEHYLVFEFVDGGNLVDYLVQNQRTLTVKQLLEFIVNTLRGMVYLESKKIIHRDLACRNLLVDTKGKVKISDFGLSRENIYKASNFQVPVRWAAPEMLNQQAVTSKSDVFSFGVVMWEIFSFGLKPYTTFSNNQVIDLVLKSEKRNLLERPSQCPEPLYQLMESCWALSPDERPTFKALLNQFGSIFENIVGLALEEDVTESTTNGDGVAYYMTTSGEENQYANAPNQPAVQQSDEQYANAPQQRGQ